MTTTSTTTSAIQTATVVSIDGETREVNAPRSVKFNRTNQNVDWAAWTWNPVTGCDHGCEFCYARSIALMKRMEPFYPFGFRPAFREYMLDAPSNTKIPNTGEPRDGRVFVCSMADLFGKWIPDEWIDRVFAACQMASGWEYLFLTKWPRRYASMPLLDGAWYGTSVVKQTDVARVERAMCSFDALDCIRWISMEPLLEPITFNDISWCDLMVIGAQTQTKQPHGPVPAFAPEFDWIVDVVVQCREAGVPYYIKLNTGRAAPGMKLPKMEPRCRRTKR